METLLLFVAVGFLAQMVDGALGMAYGVISSSVLMAFGVPPAAASATIHVAEVFTTGASATSHILHKNVEWRLFWPLMLAGVVGGSAGAYLLTQLDGNKVKPFVSAYLACIGAYILYRTWRRSRPHEVPQFMVPPLGLAGGFLDAIGGGGWGPMVTSTLVGAGKEPRRAIGTVNAAEFFVTVAVSAAFLFVLLTGQWRGTVFRQQAWSVGGLILGGILAAPLAGWVVKVIPARALQWGVGLLILALSAWQISHALLKG